MIDLTLTEATLLKRFLEDPDGIRALNLFFVNQASYYSDQCTQLLLADEVAPALKSAHQSVTYSDAMTHLSDFIQKQMRRHD